MIENFGAGAIFDCDSCGCSSYYDLDTIKEVMLKDSESVIDMGSPDKLKRSLCAALGLNMHTSSEVVIKELKDRLL